MTLRRQFIFIALLSLTLPWVGLRAFEATGKLLHQKQIQSLEREAEAFAIGLQGREDLVLNIPERYRDGSGLKSLLLRPLAIAPQIDGWVNDWSDPPLMSVQQGQRGLLLYGGVSNNHRVFAVVIEEPEPRFGTLNKTRPNHDFIELTLWSGGRRQQWILNPFAPGTLQAEQFQGRTLTASESPIRAAWQSTQMMHTVEIEIPLDLPVDRINIVYQGEDDAGSDRLALSGTALAQPFWLLTHNDNARAYLQQIRTPATTISLIDRWGWPIARHHVETDASSQDMPWVFRRLLQSLVLQGAQQPIDVEPLPNGQLDTEALSQAMLAPATLTSGNRVGEVGVRVVTPVLSNNEVVAFLLFETTDLTSASSMYAAYFWICLLALMAGTTIVLALLGYIGWLVLRVTRLSASFTRHALDIGSPRLIGAGDELKQIEVTLDLLRTRVDGEAAMLQELGKTLTHELRTPIAMVNSSLESIATDSSAEHLETAVERARSGVTRLESMMTALGEAQQLERALASGHRNKVDLSALLRELGTAYQHTFPDYHFVVETEHGIAEANIDADAVVQAIDKLIDNARSYSAPGGDIVLALEGRGLWWRISIKNEGSSIPLDEAHRLFSPMFSLRSRRSGDKTHLGLGLHVVNLVAEHHGGQPYAVNTEQGVAIGFTIEAGRS